MCSNSYRKYLDHIWNKKKLAPQGEHFTNQKSSHKILLEWDVNGPLLALIF
jgi:hypothetical protein